VTAPLRVLVTAAGGPAAIAAMKSLRAEDSVQLIAADMDPWAAGLYLTPERTLVPAGVALLLASAAALDVILDKLTLAEHCAGVVRVPRTEPFGPSLDPAGWTPLRRRGGRVPRHSWAAGAGRGGGQDLGRHRPARPAGRA
jgi:hypothetical protein